MYNEVDACLEVLNRLNLSGDISLMDDELKKEVVESFMNTGYIKIKYLNSRPVVIYQDEKRSLYLYGDSYRELNDEEIQAIDSLN